MTKLQLFCIKVAANYKTINYPLIIFKKEKIGKKII